jgi:RimJ/RimL family protein N-acetyltransferase
MLSVHAEMKSVWKGPTYLFRTIPSIGTSTVRMTSKNVSLLETELSDRLPGFLHQQPMVAIIEDGQTVAICASVRITAAAHEAGVEVLGPYRKRGYASAAVSAWVKTVREISALPMYSASDENFGSQKVAARLGLS